MGYHGIDNEGDVCGKSSQGQIGGWSGLSSSTLSGASDGGKAMPSGVDGEDASIGDEFEELLGKCGKGET